MSTTPHHIRFASMFHSCFFIRFLQSSLRENVLFVACWLKSLRDIQHPHLPTLRDPRSASCSPRALRASCSPKNLRATSSLTASKDLRKLKLLKPLKQQCLKNLKPLKLMYQGLQ